MTDFFPEALELTLKYEGGYVHDKDDPGGATNFGITQAVYDEWRDACGLPREPVKNIKRGSVENIYRNQYWLPAGCASKDRRTAIVLFDCAVNHGVGQARRFLSRVGLGEDRPKSMIAQRRTFFRNLAKSRPSSAKFLKGWLNRCDALEKAVGLG